MYEIEWSFQIYIFFSIENVVNYINLYIFQWELFICGTNYKVYVFVGVVLRREIPMAWGTTTDS